MNATATAALDLIAKRLAAPKNFRVVTTYACGKTRIHETETMEQAENYAHNDRPRIGKSLLSRQDGKTVIQIVSVEIEVI